MVGMVSRSRERRQVLCEAKTNVRYALACRDATNRALTIRGPRDNSGLGWLRHDKLKHIGHSDPKCFTDNLRLFFLVNAIRPSRRAR